MAWVRVCGVDEIEREDVLRFDRGARTFAIYRSPEGEFFATDGLCTHEKAHLADGLVLGHLIECPKHIGRFDYRTGACRRAPVTVPLRTYSTRVQEGSVLIELEGDDG